jgi:hypothetical protein
VWKFWYDVYNDPFPAFNPEVAESNGETQDKDTLWYLMLLLSAASSELNFKEWVAVGVNGAVDAEELKDKEAAALNDDELFINEACFSACMLL